MSHLGQRLSALIDGELDGDERDRVLVHLARCEPCRGEAIALRTLKRRMNALGEAAADSALTRRLMGLARPDSLGPGQSGAAAWSRLAADPLGGDHGGRELRPAWYVAFGAAAVVLVGVGAAAFLAGGGADRPEPRVTPAVDTYVMQHDLLTGVVPGTTTPPARNTPRPAASPSKSFASFAP